MNATNILPRGRRRRVVNGAVVAALALAVSIIIVVQSASPVWGVAVFGLVFVAALLLLQAREGT
jgi:hypothetical protein